MTEKHILNRLGCPIHYWLHGPADAPLLVLTHGAGMDHHTFDRQVEHFSGTYRTLVWDVRGHGLSQPVGDTFTYGQLAEDLLALLDNLHAGQAFLVGHSMGAAVTQEFAFRYPQRIKAMILIGSPSILVKPAWTDQAMLRGMALVTHFLNARQIQNAIAATLAGTPETQEYFLKASASLPKSRYQAIYRALATCYHAEPDYHPAFPILLTCGERDAALVKNGILAWAQADPGVRQAILANAGHNAHQDAAAAFNQLLDQFLQEARINTPSPG